MRTIREAVEYCDFLAPFETAEPWDNAGLLIGDENAPLTGILVTLDVTKDAVREAAETGCSLIVSHHPVIFRPLARLEAESVPACCVRNGLSVVSLHTNLDAAGNGVNRALGEALGLAGLRPFGPAGTRPSHVLRTSVPAPSAEEVFRALTAAGAGETAGYESAGCFSAVEGRFVPKPGAHPARGRVGQAETVPEILIETLVPPGREDAVLAALRAAHPYEEPNVSLFPNGADRGTAVRGMIGNLPEPLSPESFALLAETALRTRVVYTERVGSVRAVAVTGGAGSEFLGEAAKAGADAFVTGEVKHHEWFLARERNLMLVAAGHYETEQPAMDLLALSLRKAFPELPVRLSAGCPTRRTGR